MSGKITDCKNCEHNKNCEILTKIKEQEIKMEQLMKEDKKEIEQFTKDELYEIEKLLDIQATQLIQIANKVAHTLIIAEADEERNKEKIESLQTTWEEINKAIRGSIERRRKCETMRKRR